MAAGVVVGGLLFNVNASTADFEKKMKRVQRDMDKLGKKVASAGKAMTAAFAPAAAALTAMGISARATGRDFGDLATQLNINVESLQAFYQAAEDNGASMGNVNIALANLMKRTSQAASGNKEMAKAFASVGLNAEQLIQLPLDQRMVAVAKALRSAKDPAAAMAAQMKILGEDNGVKLIGALDDIAKGTDVLIAKYKELGVVLSETDVNNLNEMDVALKRLGATLKVQVAAAFSEVWSIIRDSGAVEKITTLARDASKWFQGLSRETKELSLGFIAIGAALGPVTFLAGKMISAFAPMLGIATKIVVGIKGIGAAVGLALGPITAIIGGIVVATAAVFAFTGALDGIGKSLIGERLTLQLKIFTANLLKTAVEWGAKMLVMITDIDRYTTAALSTGLAWIVYQFQNGLIEKIGKAIEWSWNGFKEMISGVGHFMKDALTGAFDMFMDTGKRGLNLLISAFNKISPKKIDLFDVDEEMGGLSKTLADAAKRAVAPLQTVIQGGVKDAANNFDWKATFQQAMGEGDTLFGSAVKSLAGSLTGGMERSIGEMEKDLAAMKESSKSVADSSKKTADNFDRMLKPIKESQRILAVEFEVLKLRASGQEKFAQALEDEINIRTQIKDVMEKSNLNEKEAEAYLREKLRLERLIAGERENDRRLTREERKAAKAAERERKRAEKRAAREAKDPRIDLGEGQGKKRWSEMSISEQSKARARFDQGYGADGKIRPEFVAQQMANKMLGGLDSAAANVATPATPAFAPPVATAAAPAATVSPAAAQAQQQQQQGDAKGGGDGGLVGAINALIQAITNGNANLTQTIATAFPA